MKKLLLLSISALLLCACTEGVSSIVSSSNSTSSDETSSITSNTSDGTSSEESESTSSSSQDGVEVMTFQHSFKNTDFTQGGGELSVNGLTFTYDAFSFLGGNVLGVQIGSKNNPQTTPWSLKTSFPEGVKVLGYTIELSNASSGSANYSVEFGDYSFNEDFSSPNVVYDVVKEGLDVEANSFALTLKANSKAIYFGELSITLSKPSDLDFEVSGDSVVADPVEPGKNGIPEINYQDTTKEEYYKDVNLDLEGEELVTSLRNKISTMTKTSYEDAKTMLQYTDESITNPGYLYGLYDGDLIYATWDSGASWNREHVWACSQMQIGGGDPRPSESTKNHATDLHNLRVACQLANGAHGNKFYDETTTDLALFPNITEGLLGDHAYKGDFRGDVARILFYMYVRYDGLELNDDLDTSNNVSMGKLSLLIEWNKADPVDEFEIQRNNRIYNYQGNRNPFIDYSDLADKIF